MEDEKHPKDLILHSDQEQQFVSWEFVMFCKEQGMTHKFTFESVEMLDKMTKEYINCYNYVRPHSYNNYLTPMEARFA